MPKLTLKIHERLRALDLLKEGHTIESAVTHLYENYHSDREITEVQKAYFPKFGPFVISHLVGASHEDIDAKAAKIKENFEKQSASGARVLSRLHLDADFKAKQLAAIAKLNTDPNFIAAQRKRASEKIKRQLQDPEFQAAIKKGGEKSMANLNQDPAFNARRRERQRERMIEQNADPIFKEKRLGGIKKLFANPVFRAKHKKVNSARFKLIRNTPEFKEKMLAAIARFAVENKELLSQRLKQQRADPKFLDAIKIGMDRRRLRLQNERYDDAKVNLDRPEVGFENGRPVLRSVADVEDDIDNERKLRVVNLILNKLPANARRVVLIHFGLVKSEKLSDEDKLLLTATLAQITANPLVRRLF